jgi:hypothetical protein
MGGAARAAPVQEGGDATLPAGRGNGLQQVHSLSCGCILTWVDFLFTKLWPLNRATPPSLNAD